MGKIINLPPDKASNYWGVGKRKKAKVTGGTLARRQKYTEHLKSDYWKNLRQNVFSIYQNKCVKCQKKASVVHHLHYKNFGREHFRDVVPLCTRCHNKIHNRHEPKKKKSLPCKNCLENQWEYKYVDGWIIATCVFCQEESEFKAK